MENSSQMAGQANEFEGVKTRLEEIAREVDDENLSLDEALDLYEEAVKLGLQASDLLEAGIVVEAEAPVPDALVSSGDPVGAALVPPGSPQANNGDAPASDNAATND